jgi:hypothetical protein
MPLTQRVGMRKKHVKDYKLIFRAFRFFRIPINALFTVYGTKSQETKKITLITVSLTAIVRNRYKE